MTQQTVDLTDEELRARRLRRVALLEQREHAAQLRRRRGFTLRLPASKPLVLAGGSRGERDSTDTGVRG
jgi:hypothetical protein